MIFKLIAYVIIAVALAPIAILGWLAIQSDWMWSGFLVSYLFMFYEVSRYLMSIEVIDTKFGGNDVVGGKENVVALLNTPKKTKVIKSKR